MVKSFKNQCFEKNVDPPLTETPSRTSQMYCFYSARTGIDRLGVRDDTPHTWSRYFLIWK